ncbi:MAG: response regulator [Geobacter sp.]|nr:response regulator [Geobacter sp.]
MVRDMIVQLLDGCGYRVTSAASPAVALELLETSTAPYDLLVSDVIMPGMNGPELYDRILDRFPDTKALFISGYTDDPAFTNITRSSAVSFLAKPFAVDALLTQVRELLGNP